MATFCVCLEFATKPFQHKGSSDLLVIVENPANKMVRVEWNPRVNLLFSLEEPNLHPFIQVMGKVNNNQKGFIQLLIGRVDFASLRKELI